MIHDPYRGCAIHDFLTGAFTIGDSFDKVLDALRAALASTGHSQQELEVAAAANGNFSPLLVAGGGGGGGGTATSQWGTLTIAGNGLPATLTKTFQANMIPNFTGNSVIWSNVTFGQSAPVTNFATSSNQTVTINLSQAGALTSVAVQQIAPAAILGQANCAPSCPGIVYTEATRTVTFTNAAMTFSGTQATLNGTLSYSNVAPQAGTTVTNAALVACPAVASPDVPGSEATFANAACLNGALKGVSDLGNVCTLSVSNATQTVQFQSDDFNQTIGFVTQTTAGVVSSNFIKGGIFNSGTALSHIWIFNDPLAGTAASYKSIWIDTNEPLTGSNAQVVSVQVHGTVRSTSATGTIISRGVCYVRMPPGA